MFRVIPAIDLKNRKCVSLIQGIPGTERVSIDNPLDVAWRWIKGGAGIIHLIDLDGAIEGLRLNSSIIESIIKVPGWNAGRWWYKVKKDAQDLLSLGVDRIILGTAAIRQPSLIKELAHEFGKKQDHGRPWFKKWQGYDTWLGWTIRFLSYWGWQEIRRTRGRKHTFLKISIQKGYYKELTRRPHRKLVDALEIPVIASGGITTYQISNNKGDRSKRIVIGGRPVCREFLPWEKRWNSMKNKINSPISIEKIDFSDTGSRHWLRFMIKSN